MRAQLPRGNAMRSPALAPLGRCQPDGVSAGFEWAGQGAKGGGECLQDKGIRSAWLPSDCLHVDISGGRCLAPGGGRLGSPR